MMDSNRIKAVVDLHEYIEEILGADRPTVGVMLKELAITPLTMQDAVMQTAMACHIAIPEAAFAICNHLFKLGVIIGYKYAIKKGMEASFNTEENPDEKPN